MDELRKKNWRNARDNSWSKENPGRIPVEFLVELLAGFLEQIAGKLLKKLQEFHWRSSGENPRETPEEFLKEMFGGAPKKFRKNTWINTKRIL